MVVYITKMPHGKYNYLANWRDPASGYGHFDWFETLRDLYDYTSGWGARYVRQ